MSNEITNRLESKLDELDTELLLMSNYIGTVVAHRNTANDNWGDVGTVNRLCEKASELLNEIKSYSFTRVQD